MDTRTQTLPPGWRIEATAPFPGSRACVLRLVHADGAEARWQIEEGTPQSEAVKQLAAALALTGARVVELYVAADGPVAGKTIREVQWPEESVIASVRRKGKLHVPHGNTKIQAGDRLTVVIAPEYEGELSRLFQPD